MPALRRMNNARKTVQPKPTPLTYCSTISSSPVNNTGHAPAPSGLLQQGAAAPSSSDLMAPAALAVAGREMIEQFNKH